MSHQHGTYLGAVRDLESLRGRCVVEGDCWHFKSSRGRPMEPGKRHPVWVHGVGLMTVTRAAWTLRTGQKIPRGRVVSRTCDSYDCANPYHMRCWKKADEGEFYRRTGRGLSVRKTIANRRQKGNSKLSQEVRRWVIESPQSGVDIAHAVGVSQSRANGIRARARTQEAA
jgi:hypothetical protein